MNEGAERVPDAVRDLVEELVRLWNVSVGVVVPWKEFVSLVWLFDQVSVVAVEDLEKESDLILFEIVSVILRVAPMDRVSDSEEVSDTKLVGVCECVSEKLSDAEADLPG